MAAQATLFGGDEEIRTVPSPRKGRRLTPFERAVADDVIGQGVRRCSLCGDVLIVNGLCFGGHHGTPILQPPDHDTAASAQWMTRWRARIGALVERADEPVLRFERADEVSATLARLWPLVREAARIDGPIAQRACNVRNGFAQPVLSVVAWMRGADTDSWIARAHTDTVNYTVRHGSECYQTGIRSHIALLDEAAKGDRAALAVWCDMAQEAGLDVPPAERWRLR